MEGLATAYDHDDAGNVTKEIDQRGIETRFEYDPLGQQTRVIRNYVSGSSSAADEDIIEQTWYDAMGWVIATRDPLGIVTRYITDPLGRVTKTIVNCTDTSTTPTSAPTTCVGAGTHNAATNVVTDMTYDAQGNLLSSTIRDPAGVSSKDVRTEHAYDAAGNRTVTIVDQGSGKLNLTTRFGYDELGRKVAEFDARGTTTAWTLDEAGNITEEVRNCTNSGTTALTSSTFAGCTGTGTANATWNVETEYAYDDLGRQVSETAPNGKVTTTTYDAAGRVLSVTDNDVASPSGNQDLVTTYAYDDDGRQTGVRSPTSSRTSFAVTKTVYDALGRATSVVFGCTDSGTTVPSTPVCAQNGTPAPTVDASHNITTTATYDAVGNIVEVEAPDPAAGTGSTATVKTRYVYDGAGRLCRVIEGFTGSATGLTCTSSLSSSGADDNVSTRYIYDKGGNLVEAIDAEGHAQSYAYDRLGRMTVRNDGLNADEVWTYDVRGNRLSLDGRISGSSDLVSWTYDAADRMLTRVADSQTTSYAYDANGNMTSASYASKDIDITYDRLDRQLSVTPDTGTATEYGYGFTTVTRSDGAGSYSFDIDKWGRQTSMDPPGAGAHTSAWRPDGLPGTSTDPNGTTTTRTYDDAGRLTGLTIKEGASNRAVIGYTHNRAGLARTHAQTITGATSGNGTASFAYDHLGRITGYDSPIGSTSDRDYAWAKVVNRTGVTSDPSGTPSTATLAYNAADRITTSGHTTDAQGRMTARPSRQFVWDSLGRLTVVKDSAGATLATYTYDAIDRIRTRVSGGVTLTFRYVGTSSSLSLLYDSTAGATDRRFTNDLAEQPVGYLSASSTDPVSWVVDGHHDVVGTIGDNGDVGRWYRYDPDGTQVATGGTGAGSHQRFQSSYTDTTTGLVWMVTRWYDPTLGRFISEDSLLGEPRNPDSRHRYAYGEGDPVNTWDPDGRFLVLIGALVMRLAPLVVPLAKAAFDRFAPAVPRIAGGVRATVSAADSGARRLRLETKLLAHEWPRSLSPSLPSGVIQRQLQALGNKSRWHPQLTPVHFERIMNAPRGYWVKNDYFYWGRPIRLPDGRYEIGYSMKIWAQVTLPNGQRLGFDARAGRWANGVVYEITNGTVAMYPEYRSLYQTFFR